MANPLARAVMKSIVNNEGKSKGNLKPSVADIELDKSEESIFSSILNKGNLTSNTSSSSKSNNRKEYSNNSKATDKLGSLKTLDVSSINKEKQNKKKTAYGQKSNYNNISSGKSSVGAVSLSDLASGKSEGKSSESKQNVYSKKNTETNISSSGMVSLNNLASGDKKPEEKKPQYGSKSNSAPIRSNVIGNLDDLVPKVTLDSIGKKGSLF